MTTSPIKIAIVGTGYAAKKRAQSLLLDSRAQLITVWGNNPSRTQAFCQEFSLEESLSWLELVNREDLDLIFICTTNHLHYEIALEALKADKNVVVEYPLALDPTEAKELIDLATIKGKLLHVEHIELLGGVHQAIANNLNQLGNIFYAHYITIAPESVAPRNWKYHYESFGFPLKGALSRIHRLTALFGEVKEVECKTRYWDAPDRDYFTSCFCNAQLKFNCGVTADIIYGKGEIFAHGERTFELYGDKGKLIFQGEKGLLIQAQKTTEIKVSPRQGLFQKDTTLVLDYLTEGKPLYVSPQQSYYALQVAHLAQVN
jgi:biliverdin reductase